MKKKWTILTLVIILLAVLASPLVFTLYVNMSSASIYYGVSITGLENRTVSEPVTILVPVPLIYGTSALPEEKLPPDTNGWNVSFVETEHGQMIALTSTEPVLRDPVLSIWQHFSSAFGVQVTDTAQLHFSTENRSSYPPLTALIYLSGLAIPENGTVTIDISFQTSSKYEDLLMQPDNMRGIYSLSATESITSDTESGWIAIPIEEHPRKASYIWFTPDNTISADDPRVTRLTEEDFVQYPVLEMLLGGIDSPLAAMIVRNAANNPSDPQPIITDLEVSQLRFAYSTEYIEWNGTVYEYKIGTMY